MEKIERIRKSILYRLNHTLIKVKNTLFQNIFCYKVFYSFYLIYYKITSRFYKFSDNKVNFDSIKSAAIVYSKRHFDPKSSTEFQYSASNISRQIYSSFEGKKIYYFDHSEKINIVPSVDIVVGIVSNNFIKLAKENIKAKKVLFIVNSHPLYRLQSLIKESILLKKIFPFSEYVNPIVFLKSIKYADRFLVIGNNFVKDTFVKYRIPENKISLLDTGANILLKYDQSKRPKDKIRVLFVGSHLAIRKGLFRVIQVWDELCKSNVSNFELVIIGGIDVFSKDLDGFLKRHGNASYLGWIESNTDEYRDWLQSSHIIINLSIEEGQVGCVLDGMQCGSVPIISEESGIGITSGRDGFIVKHDDIKGIVEKIKILSNKEKMDIFRENCLKYINENHNWEKFRKDFRQALEK